MNIGLDAGHDLLQVLDAIGFDAVGLDGVVDAGFDHRTGVHAQGLGGVGIGLDGAGFSVQFGHGEQDVDSVGRQVRLHVFGKDGRAQVHELGDVVVGEVREDDAGAVDDADLLRGLLGAHHDQGREDGDGGKQHRSQEGDDKEALFLNLVKILALDDDA